MAEACHLVTTSWMVVLTVWQFVMAACYLVLGAGSMSVMVAVRYCSPGRLAGSADTCLLILIVISYDLPNPHEL